jgi:antitoxin component of MazEF toxin-antitoxin module
MQNEGFKYKLYMYNYMEQLKTKIKRWGNSFGIVVPMDIIRKENLREDADVTVSIQTSRTITVGELMDLSIKLGVAKKLKNVDTQKALREVDKAFWPEGD